MPVPVWTEMGLLDKPLNASLDTIVSVDVWKKFDLDLPLEYCAPPPFESFDYCEDDFDYNFQNVVENVYTEASEIRHHDCMWAGLCISKEHNGAMPTKMNPQIHKKVPAGRSLLIPKAEPKSSQTPIQQPTCRRKNLESDGDSPRPETPQSSEESEPESDYEPPIFRHDQISINERLSECLSETAINAVPVSVVTGQQVRPLRKRIASEYNVKEETDVRYTLSDHCYHLKKLEHLGVQTPSDSESHYVLKDNLSKEEQRRVLGNRKLLGGGAKSRSGGVNIDSEQHVQARLSDLEGETGSSSDTEEEIDVVSYDKPSRQTTVLPTFPSPADQQQFQLTVKTAFKEKPSRPRGRPPLAANARKRAAPAPPPAVTNSAKRPKRSKSYQKRSKYSDIDDIPLPPTNGIKCIPPSRSSSDDEPDTEKRSLHNNMERQRRIDLRKAFEDLRLLVPAVERNEKAPKVSILRQAAAYCDKMTKEDELYSIQVTELQDRQERLRVRLSQLRKDFANSR